MKALLKVVYAVAIAGLVIFWAQTSQQSTAAPVPEFIKALAAAQSCSSSRDCMPSTEHCVNGRCELRSSRCYNNFDCSGTDKCVSGSCRPL
jgi:hypothetical protein